MAFAYAAATSHCQVALLERASRPPSKCDSVALPCFCLRENFFSAPLIGHGGQDSPRPAGATLLSGARLPSLRFSLAFPVRGVLSQNANGRTSPGAQKQRAREDPRYACDCRSADFDFVNTRFRRLGLAGQWCLTCSLTPRAVKKRPQCSQAVFFGDTFPCIS